MESEIIIFGYNRVAGLPVCQRCKILLVQAPHLLGRFKLSEEKPVRIQRMMGRGGPSNSRLKFFVKNSVDREQLITEAKRQMVKFDWWPLGCQLGEEILWNSENLPRVSAGITEILENWRDSFIKGEF